MTQQAEKPAAPAPFAMDVPGAGFDEAALLRESQSTTQDEVTHGNE